MLILPEYSPTPNLLQVQRHPKTPHPPNNDRLVRPAQGGVRQSTSKTSPSAPYTKTMRLQGKGFANDAGCSKSSQPARRSGIVRVQSSRGLIPGNTRRQKASSVKQGTDSSYFKSSRLLSQTRRTILQHENQTRSCLIQKKSFFATTWSGNRTR